MRTCGVTFQKLGCILLLCLSMQIATPAEPLNFYIDYSLIPDEAAMRAHDLSIVSPQARFDMTRVHKTGQEIYAYISVVEVASDAPYRPKLEPSGIRLMGTNELWKSDFADIAAPEWTRFVLKELAAPIVEQGFDGFFLDTVDSHELLAKGFPDRAEEFRKGIISLIKALKSAHPTKKIILNRGFPIWEELKESIDGVLVESVFQTFEGLGGKYKPVTNSDSDWLIGHIRRIQAANLPVYVVDYSDPSRADLAMATAKRIQDLGCHAFVTTPQLKGVTLAPIHEKPRRLLVLFGNQDTEAVRVEWATDSELKTTSQSPLEWLGFEMDFLNLSRDPLPETLGGKYLGVVIDRSLRIPVEQELKTVDWLIAQKDAGKKNPVPQPVPHSRTRHTSKTLPGLWHRRHRRLDLSRDPADLTHHFPDDEFRGQSKSSPDPLSGRAGTSRIQGPSVGARHRRQGSQPNLRCRVHDALGRRGD
jgi:polysaccharide biosynthesis protein PelA